MTFHNLSTDHQHIRQVGTNIHIPVIYEVVFLGQLANVQ